MFTCRLRPATTTFPVLDSSRQGLKSRRAHRLPTIDLLQLWHPTCLGLICRREVLDTTSKPMSCRCALHAAARGSRGVRKRLTKTWGKHNAQRTHTKLLSAQTSWFGSTPPANETRGDQIRLRWRSRDTHQVSETLTRHAKRQSRPGLPPCAGSRIATATAGPARSYPGYWIRLSPEAAR